MYFQTCFLTLEKPKETYNIEPDASRSCTKQKQNKQLTLNPIKVTQDSSVLLTQFVYSCFDPSLIYVCF